MVMGGEYPVAILPPFSFTELYLSLEWVAIAIRSRPIFLL